LLMGGMGGSINDGSSIGSSGCSTGGSNKGCSNSFMSLNVTGLHGSGEELPESSRG
jgi:hypothetical protein